MAKVRMSSAVKPCDIRYHRVDRKKPLPPGVFLFTMFPDCVPWGFLFAGKETPTEHSITKYIRSIQTNLTFKLLWNDALEFLDSGGFLCSMVAYKSTPTAPLLM